MTQTDGTPTILTADAGMMLTQAAEVALIKRIVTPRVVLAVNDSADRWREITAGQAEEIKAAQAAAFEQMKQQRNGTEEL